MLTHLHNVYGCFCTIPGWISCRRYHVACKASNIYSPSSLQKEVRLCARGNMYIIPFNQLQSQNILGTEFIPHYCLITCIFSFHLRNFIFLKEVYCQCQNIFRFVIARIIAQRSVSYKNFSLLSFYLFINCIKRIFIRVGKFHNHRGKKLSLFSGRAKRSVIHLLFQTRLENLVTEAAVKMEMQSQKELSAL